MCPNSVRCTVRARLSIKILDNKKAPILWGFVIFKIVSSGSPERIKVRTLDQLLTRLLKVLPFLPGQFSPPLFRSC
jgi:hypothetical protein